MCTGGDPGLYQCSKLSLRTRCGQTSLARMPCPPDQSVRGHVLADFRETASAVSRAILQLHADFAQRFVLPGHRGRSDTPLRVTRDAGNRGYTRCEVRISMARLAWQSRNSMVSRACVHRGYMRVQIIALRRPTCCRMAVHAARILDHLARLSEQSHRPGALIADHREGRRRFERDSLRRCISSRRTGNAVRKSSEPYKRRPSVRFHHKALNCCGSIRSCGFGGAGLQLTECVRLSLANVLSFWCC